MWPTYTIRKKYLKLLLTSLQTRQANDHHNLEHSPLLAYVYICVYNTTTIMRSLPFAMERTQNLGYRPRSFYRCPRPYGWISGCVWTKNSKSNYPSLTKASKPPLFFSVCLFSFNFRNWFKLVHRAYSFKVTWFQVNMRNLSKE